MPPNRLQKNDAGVIPLWTLADIAVACGGKAHGHELLGITGVSIDTRTLKPGDLFIAIKGPKADGHDYLHQAQANGASAVLISDPSKVPEGLAFVLAKDTEAAMVKLGVAARERTLAKVIGVTGSYGKTGIKDALIYLLSQQGLVTGTERSFNNHWGTPLTLARMGQGLDYGVFEMGMNHEGELTTLSSWVQPQVALINNVAGAHIGNFKNLEAVAEAKAEIMHGMAPGSIIVLNKDGGFYELLKNTALKANLKVISFGMQTPGDFSCLGAVTHEEGTRVHCRTPLGEIAYVLPVKGEHWVANSLAILAVIFGAGGDIVQASRDLEGMSLGAGRGRSFGAKLPQGTVKVIDESYNAGPASMIAALRVLGATEPGAGGRRIAVLGDMLELGDQALSIHQSLLEDLKENKVDLVYVSGTLMDELFKILPEPMRGLSDLDIQNLAPKILADLMDGDVIMVKGSRGQRAYEGRMAEVIKLIEKSQKEMS